MNLRWLKRACLLGFALGAPAAFAGVTPPEPGTFLADATGPFEELTLASESLRLDLRPLAAADPHVVVDVQYWISHRASTRRVRLIWPTAGVGPGTIGGAWLDERPLTVEEAPSSSRPEDWVPPESTPPLVDGPRPPLALSAWDDHLLATTVELSPGTHALRLRYGARAAADHSQVPPLWQIAYVLTPARRFAAFRLLEINVLVPEGWAVAADPSLATSPFGLRGTFATPPAPALALTVRGPRGGLTSAPTPALAEARPDPRRRALRIAITVLLLPGLFMLGAFLALRWLTSRGKGGSA